MQAYSQDLRERVARACDEGRGTRTQIADLFGVSTSWIRKLLQRRREAGSLAAKPHGGGRPRKLGDGQRRQLVALVVEQPDATLAELRDRLCACVHVSTVHRALARVGLTVKKKTCAPPSRTAPTCGTSGPPSAAGPPASTRRGSCSSTRSGRTPP
jgi:transposase